MFNVLCLETNQLELNISGDPLIFENGVAAADYARAMTATAGKKYQVRRAENNVDWKAREQERFNSGHYESPKWLAKYCVRMVRAGFNPDLFSEHAIHVSKRDPSKIAYTQDAIKGAADIQTPVRVGSYLTQYCPEMSPDMVKEIALEHANIYVGQSFLIATTPDEIEEVYRNGPNSCMSKGLSYFSSSQHPVRVYGDSDLQLAYLKNENGHFSARALICRETMTFYRIYGDVERLEHALKRVGYSRGDFEGARIRRLVCENNNRLILPYLDGIQSVSIFNAEFLKIDSDGEIYADTTDGLERGETCERCERSANETTSVYTDVRYTEQWCSRCVENHSFYCEGINETVSDDSVVTVDGETYASWYNQDERHFCDFSQEYTFDEIVVVYDIYERATAYNASRTPTLTQGVQTKYCRADQVATYAFKCRVDGEYWSLDCKAVDTWAQEPRSLHNEPNDIPTWYVGDVAHNDTRQLQFYLSA